MNESEPSAPYLRPGWGKEGELSEEHKEDVKEPTLEPAEELVEILKFLTVIASGVALVQKVRNRAAGLKEEEGMTEEKTDEQTEIEKEFTRIVLREKTRYLENIVSLTDCISERGDNPQLHLRLLWHLRRATDETSTWATDRNRRGLL